MPFTKTNPNITPAANKLHWTKKDDGTYVAIVGEGRYQIERVTTKYGKYDVHYYPNQGQPQAGDFIATQIYYLDTAKREAEKDHNLRTSHDAYRGRAMDAVDHAVDMLRHARTEAAMPHVGDGYYGLYGMAINELEDVVATLQRIQHLREREETTKTL